MAPFFTDIDISVGIGQINYEIHTRSSSENILSLVNLIINKQTETEFSGNWLLVSTWDNVPQFGGDYNIVSKMCIAFIFYFYAKFSIFGFRLTHFRVF